MQAPDPADVIQNQQAPDPADVVQSAQAPDPADAVAATQAPDPADVVQPQEAPGFMSQLTGGARFNSTTPEGRARIAATAHEWANTTPDSVQSDPEHLSRFQMAQNEIIRGAREADASGTVRQFGQAAAHSALGANSLGGMLGHMPLRAAAWALGRDNMIGDVVNQSYDKALRDSFYQRAYNEQTGAAGTVGTVAGTVLDPAGMATGEVLGLGVKGLSAARPAAARVLGTAAERTLAQRVAGAAATGAPMGALYGGAQQLGGTGDLASTAEATGKGFVAGTVLGGAAEGSGAAIGKVAGKLKPTAEGVKNFLGQTVSTTTRVFKNDAPDLIYKSGIIEDLRGKSLRELTESLAGMQGVKVANEAGQPRSIPDILAEIKPEALPKTEQGYLQSAKAFAERQESVAAALKQAGEELIAQQEPKWQALQKIATPAELEQLTAQLYNGQSRNVLLRIKNTPEAQRTPFQAAVWDFAQPIREHLDEISRAAGEVGLNGVHPDYWPRMKLAREGEAAAVEIPGDRGTMDEPHGILTQSKFTKKRTAGLLANEQLADYHNPMDSFKAMNDQLPDMLEKGGGAGKYVAAGVLNPDYAKGGFLHNRAVDPGRPPTLFGKMQPEPVAPENMGAPHTVMQRAMAQSVENNSASNPLVQQHLEAYMGRLSAPVERTGMNRSMSEINALGLQTSPNQWFNYAVHIPQAMAQNDIKSAAQAMGDVFLKGGAKEAREVFMKSIRESLERYQEGKLAGTVEAIKSPGSGVAEIVQKFSDRHADRAIMNGDRDMMAMLDDIERFNPGFKAEVQAAVKNPDQPTAALRMARDAYIASVMPQSHARDANLVQHWLNTRNKSGINMTSSLINKSFVLNRISENLDAMLVQLPRAIKAGDRRVIVDAAWRIGKIMALYGVLEPMARHALKSALGEEDHGQTAQRDPSAMDRAVLIGAESAGIPLGVVGDPKGVARKPRETLNAAARQIIPGPMTSAASLLQDLASINDPPTKHGQTFGEKMERDLPGGGFVTAGRKIIKKGYKAFQEWQKNPAHENEP